MNREQIIKQLKTRTAKKIAELEPEARAEALSELYLPPVDAIPKDDLLFNALCEDSIHHNTQPSKSFLEHFSNWRAALSYWSVAPVLTLALILVGLEPTESPAPLPTKTAAKKHELRRYISKGIDLKMLYAHRLKDGKYQKTQQSKKDGTILFPKDELQFVYQSSAPLHFLVAGINHKGEVYTLFSKDDKMSVLCKSGKGSLSEDGRSFRLDDYKGQERFFIFFSKKSFRWGPLQRSLVTAWKKSTKNISTFFFDFSSVQYRSFWINRKKRKSK